MIQQKCHMLILHVRPSARGAQQPSRGLRSRYGANPEKYIAANFDCPAHEPIVGEAIGEVKPSEGSLKRDAR